MTHPSLFLSVSFIALIVAGCGAPSAKEAPSESQTTHHEATDTLADHDHAAHSDHDSGSMSDMDKMKAELAKLSPADAQSAMKQHFCPVSGEMLGVMGPPIKVEVNGTQLWICCESCRESLLESPEEYLAKLKN